MESIKIEELVQDCFDRADKEINELFGPCQGSGGDDCPCLSCNPPDAAQC
jgi:hypothetical protein